MMGLLFLGESGNPVIHNAVTNRVLRR
jgi:hypothetical protein